MSQNGISQLATKELRQRAKLDLAAAKRAADGNARATYDITQLPTQYDDNAVIDNANTGGLIVGRPWIEQAPDPSTVAWSDDTYFDSFTSQSGVTDTDGIDTNNLCWQLYFAHTALTIPADGVDRVGINTYKSGSNTIQWRYAISTEDDTLGSFAADQQFASRSFSYIAGGFNQQPATSAVSIPANRYFLIGVTSGPFFRTSKLLDNNRTAFVAGSPVVTVFNTFYEGARIGGPTAGIPTDLGGEATFTKHTDRVSVTSVKFKI